MASPLVRPGLCAFIPGYVLAQMTAGYGIFAPPGIVHDGSDASSSRVTQHAITA